MLTFDAAFRAEFKDNRLPLAVATICMIFAFSASSYSLPFLFPEVIGEFGWTREQATLLASTKYATGAIAALIIGRYIDKIGPLRPLAIASAVGGVALIGFLWVQSLASYYILGMMLGIAGPGTIISVKVMISQRFHRSQGTAMGVAMLGASAGSMLVPIIIAALIAWFGWRSGFALLSLGIWLVAMPTLLFASFALKKSDIQSAPAPAATTSASEKGPSTLSLVIRRPVFWIFAIAVYLGGLVDQGFIQHQVLIFTDLSLSREIVALGISAMGVIGFFARVLVGVLFDRTSTRGAAAIYGVLGLASLLAIILGNPLVFAVFVAARAVAHAGMLLETTVITKHVFGTERLGTLLGIYTAIVTAGFATGPWLMGLLYDMSNSYTPAFLIFFVLALIAAILMTFVEPTYWRAMKAADARATADS
jgi:MFS family permease